MATTELPREVGSIKPGTRVQFALADNPGRLHDSIIAETVAAVGERQIASSGTLARVTALTMTTEYPALLQQHAGIDPTRLRPGMSGIATV
jgi:hypothetical protein